MPTTTTVTNTTKKEHKRGYDGICCPVVKSCYDVFWVKWKAVSAIENNLVGPIRIFSRFYGQLWKCWWVCTLFLFSSSPNNKKVSQPMWMAGIEIFANWNNSKIKACCRIHIDQTKTQNTERERENKWHTQNVFWREKVALNITRTWTMSNKQCMTYERTFFLLYFVLNWRERNNVFLSHLCIWIRRNMCEWKTIKPCHDRVANPVPIFATRTHTQKALYHNFIYK